MPFWQNPHMRDLLVNPGLLHRMQRLLRLVSRQPSVLAQRAGRPSSVVICLPATRAHRQHARARFLAVHEHRAGAALRQPAAELRSAQFEIVAQDVQQRSVGGGVDLAEGPLTISVMAATSGKAPSYFLALFVARRLAQ